MIEIIAEIGSVHDGSIGNAINLIKAAKKCGATAVKFQYHIAKYETLKNAPSPKYFNEESRFDYFNRIEFTIEQWHKIKKICDNLKIKFICSPFSLEAVNYLEKINVDAYKIASGELGNLPMLEKISKTKKICYLSTGMSSIEEINSAVNILKSKKNTLMQCSSIYPCPAEKVGLNLITFFKENYNLKIGFSDHTLGYAASLSAISLGATVIEKHITFSKKMYGSDAKNAMEINEFKIFCDEIKFLDKILNNPVNKNNLKQFGLMRKTFMKSIIAKKDLKKNTTIKLKYLSFKKPGDGILAKDYRKVIGKKINKDIKANVKIFKRDLI